MPESSKSGKPFKRYDDLKKKLCANDPIFVRTMSIDWIKTKNYANSIIWKKKCFKFAQLEHGCFNVSFTGILKKMEQLSSYFLKRLSMIVDRTIDLID